MFQLVLLVTGPANLTRAAGYILIKIIQSTQDGNELCVFWSILSHNIIFENPRQIDKSDLHRQTDDTDHETPLRFPLKAETGKHAQRRSSDSCTDTQHRTSRKNQPINLEKCDQALSIMFYRRRYLMAHH